MKKSKRSVPLGRPLLPGARLNYLQIRVSEDELRRAKAAAKAVGKTLADYVRDLVIPTPKRKKT